MARVTMKISPDGSVYATVAVKVYGVETSQMFVVDGSANNDAALGRFILEHAIRPALDLASRRAASRNQSG
jgi:hypothetical protein